MIGRGFLMLPIPMKRMHVSGAFTEAAVSTAPSTRLPMRWPSWSRGTLFPGADAHTLVVFRH